MVQQYMKKLIKYVISDKIVKWAILFSIGLLIFQLLYVVIVYRFLPPFIPLFNQMAWGSDRLGTKIEVFLPFLIASSFFFVNFFLATYFYEKMPLVSRMISITCLLIAILSFIFILRTTQLIM
jgi:hypothetical protein